MRNRFRLKLKMQGRNPQEMSESEKNEIFAELAKYAFLKNPVSDYTKLVAIVYSFIKTIDSEKRKDYTTIFLSRLTEQQRMAFSIYRIHYCRI